MTRDQQHQLDSNPLSFLPRPIFGFLFHFGDPCTSMRAFVFLLLINAAVALVVRDGKCSRLSKELSG